MTRQIFIFGSGRSGTTVLRECFIHIPRVFAIPFETKLFLPTGIFWRFIHDPNREANYHLYDMMLRLTFDQKFKPMMNQTREDVDHHQIPWSPPDWIQFSQKFGKTPKNWTDLLFERPEYDVIVEKTPHHSRAVPTILDLYPKSKFLRIVRPPLDVISSVLTIDWGPNNVEEAAYWWLELMEVEEDVCMTYPDKVLTILLPTASSYVPRIKEFTGVEINDVFRKDYQPRDDPLLSYLSSEMVDKLEQTYRVIENRWKNG